MRGTWLLVLPPRCTQTDQVFPAGVLRRMSDISEAVINRHDRQYIEQELAGLVPGFDVCITGWRSPRFSRQSSGGQSRCAQFCPPQGRSNRMYRKWYFGVG